MAKETNIIQEGADAKHVIEGYHFKVMSELEGGDPHSQTPAKAPSPKAQATQAAPDFQVPDDGTAQGPSCELPAEPVPHSTTPPEFIENILKKTDQMSDNIIKLQMQIESQENEFKSRLENELANAKEKYLKEGEEKAKVEYDAKIEELNIKFIKSIEKLDDVCAKVQTACTKNEEELSQSAVEIAKEIVGKELEKNSGEIALHLAHELMDELKAASSVEVKLNPKDYEYVKTKLELKDGLSVSMDDAINAGSVIVQSNIGNLQTGMKERLYKLTQMLKG